MNFDTLNICNLMSKTMLMNYRSLLLFLFLISCSQAAKVNPADETLLTRATSGIRIDGVLDEEDWQKSGWMAMDQLWVGQLDGDNDFQGSYKLLWDEDFIYIAARIVDDTLMDIHADPTKRYWDDDCLEVFIDPDNSKGIHQYNHDAFAYHIALDGKVTDIGPDTLVQFYNDHVSSARQTQGDTSIWEVRMALYGANFVDDSHNDPLTLSKGDVIGFAIAYCDNDRSEEREAFIGSEPIEGEDKNRGWIDAGVFGEFRLE